MRNPSTPEPILIRIGCPESTGQLPHAVRQLGAACLISAGALWQPKQGKFREPGSLMQGLDLALDSAGFTRGLRGGYPWTVAQYVRLAGRWPYAWYAQMDFPCEAELAPDRAAVRARVKASAELFRECDEYAAFCRSFGRTTPGRPVPVLQGRRPDDYLLSAELLTAAWGGALPELVGLGSVCTRPLHGSEGLLPILEELDRQLPPHVGLHLFGVKGQALRHIRGCRRVKSMDSMGWDDRARWAAHEQKRSAANTQERIACMRGWYAKQREAVIDVAV